ncbi:MAG: beta-1,6-N-acetylglucosaminyltransferase [Chitinophagaceae bacterium]
MIKAYLILAHKYPEQLSRLVEALDDELSYFFIHIDKSSDIKQFGHFDKYRDRIQFLTREKADWASYGLVQAILHGLQAAHDSPHQFRQVILLSGQDYPIKSNDYITRFAEQYCDKIFLEYHRLPDHDKWQPHGGLYRVNKYFMGFKAWQKLCSKSLNFLSGKLSFLQRKMYGGMQPYAGSMWWIFSMPAVTYILDFIKVHPGYIAFHKYTFAVDEVFFHTILLNATDPEMARNIVNSNKRFIRWKDHKSSHPEFLSEEYFTELEHSDALFARKFEPAKGSQVLDLIDHYRLSTETV